MKTQTSNLTLYAVICMLSVSLLATEAAAQQKQGGRQRQGGPQGGPPPEALEVCQNLNEGDSCQFESPHGTISGSCRNIQQQMACAPEGMPPGSPQEQQRNGGPQVQNGQSGNRQEKPKNGRQQARQIKKSSSEPYKEAMQTSGSLNDTGQYDCFNDSKQVSCPKSDKSFYGQDAHYQGKSFSFQDNGDGTVSDLNTGLMWQKSPDLENKSSYTDALNGAESFNLAGYTDWRLPTVKELYSLIDFKGSQFTKTPYIDTDYFDFRFGEESRGERTIDAQYWTNTEYLGTVFDGTKAVFGVNFADGRIKGYPKESKRKQANRFVRYVRGNPDYGVNDFVDNSDGTISDNWTGLMWQQADSAKTVNWEQALDYCENLEYANHNDWRLPNAKELQSIVDYSRAPDAENSSQRGPALDPIFDLSQTESWFWTSTTLMESPPDRGVGSQAVYLTFGQAFGFMKDRKTGQTTKMNVHGAGAQRSAAIPKAAILMIGLADTVRRATKSESTTMPVV